MTSLNPPLKVAEPHTEGEQFCFALLRNMEGILRILEELPPEALTWRPNIPNANSPGGLAVHTVASGEWWILACVRGDTIARDRDEEFHQTMTAAVARTRFETWYQHVVALIATKPPEWFGAISQHPNGDRTNRRCLMHSVEHTAQHFGHLELMRELWSVEHPHQ